MVSISKYLTPRVVVCVGCFVYAYTGHKPLINNNEHPNKKIPVLQISNEEGKKKDGNLRDPNDPRLDPNCGGFVG